MRLANHATGMPFEAFHQGTIQIPLVVNQHLLMGRRDAVQKREPDTELGYSLKYFDRRDGRSIKRLLEAAREMVSKEKVGDLVRMGAVPKLRGLLLDEDQNLVFDALGVMVHAVSADPDGLFSGELIEGDGLEVLRGLLLRKKGADRKKNACRERYRMMIRGNALYVIGQVIGNGFARRMMDDAMVQLLLGMTHDDDPVSRGNALFCFRMALWSDPGHWFDLESTFARTLEMLRDDDNDVREEAVRLVQVCLENDIVPSRRVGDIDCLMEDITTTDKTRTARAAEAVLDILTERGQ